MSRDGCAAFWWATKSERLSSRDEINPCSACWLHGIGASEVLAPAVSGNANADLDFIETGMDAQEPASPAGKEGTEFTNRHVRVP